MQRYCLLDKQITKDTELCPLASLFSAIRTFFPLKVGPAWLKFIEAKWVLLPKAHSSCLLLEEELEVWRTKEINTILACSRLFLNTLISFTGYFQGSLSQLLEATGPGSPQERGFPCSTRHLLCFLPAYYPDLCLSVCFSSLDKFSKNRAVFCLCLGFSAAKKQTVVVQFVLLCGPVPTWARDMGPVDKGLCSLKPRAKINLLSKTETWSTVSFNNLQFRSRGYEDTMIADIQGEHKTLWRLTSLPPH